MSQDIYIESRYIGYALLWGIRLAVYYDILLILRNLIKHKNIFIYMEDFLYWMYCTLFVFDHLYKIGDGNIRWYMALLIGIGMLSYRLLLSRYPVKFVTFIFAKLLFVLKKIFRFLFAPILSILRRMKKLLLFAGKRTRQIRRMLKKKLTHRIKMLKITLCKR